MSISQDKLQGEHSVSLPDIASALDFEFKGMHRIQSIAWHAT